MLGVNDIYLKISLIIQLDRTLHITVIAKHEAQKLSIDVNTKVDISQESLQILSLGHSKGVAYLTVSWAHAQLFRKKLGLEPKDFHITISNIDRHDICKDITTTRGGYPAFLSIFQALPESAMDFILVLQLPMI